jgi:lysocardiolipin and lysophospholipid acyltransferase
MHWRRFRIDAIPIHDEAAFSDWLLARWREKDALIEHYLQHGRFPADDGTTPAVNGGEPLKGCGHIETEVRPTNMLEVLQMFALPASSVLVINVVLKMVSLLLTVLRLQ